MKIAKGVHLHVIKADKFKTNHLTFRFSGPRQEKLVARRVLVAQMLATASHDYPTGQLFKEKLASLYGAQLSTKVSTRGLVHIVDIDISFPRDSYLLFGGSLMGDILDFLKSILFLPLASTVQYQAKTFEVEKRNLINYLEADHEDNFYHSDLALQELYYDDKRLQVSKYASPDLVEQENSFSAFQECQRMLTEDRIDIFILGQVDEYKIVRKIHQFPFEDREVDLQFTYQQDYTNVTREQLEKRDSQQSVLQLAYHLPIGVFDQDYFALMVFNGLLGAFSHSKLFTKVREEAGLAYSLASQFDSYTGLLSIYAGIDREDRTRVLRLITKEFNDVKMGRFSSRLIQQTKAVLKTNARLSQDSPKSMIEQAYSREVLDKELPDLSTWIDNIDKVTKEAIVRVAGKIRLQAVYFLEGNDG